MHCTASQLWWKRTRLIMIVRVIHIAGNCKSSEHKHPTSKADGRKRSASIDKVSGSVWFDHPPLSSSYSQVRIAPQQFQSTVSLVSTLTDWSKFDWSVSAQPCPTFSFYWSKYWSMHTATVAGPTGAHIQPPTTTNVVGFLSTRASRKHSYL